MSNYDKDDNPKQQTVDLMISVSVLRLMTQYEDLNDEIENIYSNDLIYFKVSE